MPKPIKIPPIRTQLFDPRLASNGNGDNAPSGNGGNSGNDPQGLTAKEWYYYWRNIGDQVNQNSASFGEGHHASRPDPTTTPDGALYFEIDRGSLYSNEAGTWHYVAGTMWGTMSPDQRPTDLGTNDGGFQYRSTDQPQRFFMWSQTVWVEVDPLTTAGDIAYRISTGTTRLPIGTAGQVLTVAGGVPTWAASPAYNGPTNYVSLSPVFGTTYQNTYGVPLSVYSGIYFAGTAGETDALIGSASPPGSLISKAYIGAAGPNLVIPVNFTVPVGWYYELRLVSGTQTINYGYGLY